MNLSKPPRLGALLLALAVAVGAAACGSSGGGGSASPDKDVLDSSRSLGVNQDTLGQAAKQATQAKSFAWDGSTLRLTFEKGSIEDPTASINCSAVSSLVEDDESVVVIYPDGEKSCDKR